MLFAMLLKWVIVPVLVLLLIWYIWPKAAVKIEQVEKSRLPTIKKAEKLKKENLTTADVLTEQTFTIPTKTPVVKVKNKKPAVKKTK